MASDVERAYREHLTSGDLALLNDVAPNQAIVSALSSARLEQVVFGRDPGFDPSRWASPFLTFAVAVHRAAERLATRTYVEEWIGPRKRVPVFAVEPLRRLLNDPWQRFFFVELLASYTHVVSGSTWVTTPRGPRRRRFSELDPVQLAGLLDTAPAAERPGLLRRLGDLSLFLTGVFPDHTAGTPLGRPQAEAHLMRSAGVAAGGAAAASVNTFELLELLGERWYGLASRLSPAPSGTVQVLTTIAEHFADARRILNLVTDTYLFPLRERWFGRPAA